MKKVIVECLPDTVLMIELGVSRKRILHAGSKGRVVKNVEEGKGLGLIDEDPGYPQPKTLTQYRIVENLEQYGLKILAKDTKKIIMICPRLEEFILKACEESSINPQKFGLASDPDVLHREINARIRNFKMLVRELLSVRNDRLLKLKNLILSYVKA